MLTRLFLLFTIVPSIELWLLFQVKEQLGLMETIWLVILTGMIGASMAKNQGLMVLSTIQEQTQKGLPPTQTLVEGLLVLVGGILLVTPGIMTDLFGFSLIIPFTRKLWAPLVQSWFGSKVQTHTSMGGAPFGGFTTPHTENSSDITMEATGANNRSTGDSGGKSQGRFSHPKF
jgi:UPF0716 protein FxsA